MLKVRNLNVSYGGSKILRGVNFDIRPNKVVTLMGRNGVGKTTTLKTIIGLLKPTDGSIELGDTDLLSLGTAGRIRKGIGYVPQGREIFPHLSVLENLKIGMLANGTASSAMDQVLVLFPILKSMLNRKGGVLSGGQQQQLAIGRALLTNPRILILDEPTEGIQPSIIQEIGETIRKLKASGNMSILLVEQCLDFAREVADQFYIMEKGSIAAEGEISALDESLVKKYLTV